MPILIIRLSSNQSFNPFKASHERVYSVLNNRSPRHQSMHYSDLESAQSYVNSLIEQKVRFLLLEMMLAPRVRFHPPYQHNSIRRAHFYYGHFNQPISEQAPTPMPDQQKSISNNNDPLSHIPKPKSELAQIIKESENLPDEFSDPITCEPLTDPIEINKRIYNRETVQRMIKDGKFHDPMNRDVVDVSTAKSAAYMFDAAKQHAEVSSGKHPEIMSQFQNTTVYPLKSLFDAWEDTLKRAIAPR